MKHADESMTDEEIRQAGYDALVRELGIVGMIRFVQMLRPGSGDYSKDQHAWLDGLTVEDFVREAKKVERG
jgi:hypothetical protein